MAKLSSKKQIEILRPTRRFAAKMHIWFLVIALLCIIASILLWNPIPLMFAIFFSIVSLFERQAGPNIVAAISAYDRKPPSLGKATISITCWDMDNHYHVEIHEEGHPTWKYEFIPQGWEPTSSSYTAKIWRTDLEKKPILSIVKEGIMIPRYEPTKVVESINY